MSEQEPTRFVTIPLETFAELVKKASYFDMQYDVNGRKWSAWLTGVEIFVKKIPQEAMLNLAEAAKQFTERKISEKDVQRLLETLHSDEELTRMAKKLYAVLDGENDKRSKSVEVRYAGPPHEEVKNTK